MYGAVSRLERPVPVGEECATAGFGILSMCGGSKARSLGVVVACQHREAELPLITGLPGCALQDLEPAC